ncbi:MAG: hypothetical protein VX589_16815 [Myxococcota bacterium]|nr:hypothetical protein [Myxococcota bacterium]
MPAGFNAWFATACHAEPHVRCQDIRTFVHGLDSVLRNATPHENTLALQARLEDQTAVAAISTMQLNSGLTAAPHASTRLDLPAALAAASETDTFIQPTPTTGVARAQLTPVEVSELQTRIQYRLMEQLRAATEENEALVKALQCTVGQSVPDHSSLPGREMPS